MSPGDPIPAVPEGSPEFLDGASRAEVYKRTRAGTLLAHVFMPEGQEPTSRRPAVVFFFGGGWKGGTPNQFRPHCLHLASRGVVAISADYRVRSRAPERGEGDDFTPWQCVADGKSAIRWARASSLRLGIDPRRIAAGGGSAGGHVAACTALVDVPSQFDDGPGEGTSPSAVPNALVLFNPVVDTSDDRFAADDVFGSDNRAASPLHNVRPGAPPAIIFHGTADRVAPFDSVERFAKAMRDAGARCDLVPFEGRGHAFFNYDHAAARPTEDYTATVRAMDGFLGSLGWIKTG